MKIFAIVIPLGFVAIIAISVITLISHHDPVKDNPIHITNYLDTTSAPTTYLDYVSQNIYDLIETTEQTGNADLGDAIIREGSYRESTANGDKTATFIVDVESQHYSFEITMTWNGTATDQADPDIEIRCPHYLDVVYKDKKCIATNPYGQLVRYLPYNEYLDNGEKFHVELRGYSGRTYIAVIVPECMNQAQKDEANQKFKKWLKSIYLDPNDYDIETMGKCL